METVDRRRKFIIDVAYYAVLIGLFYLFFKYAFGVCLPFIVSVFIASLLQRPVNFLVRKTGGKGRGIFSTLLVIFCFAVLGSVVAILIMKLISELRDFFGFLMLKLENADQFVAQINEWINVKLVRLPESVRTGLTGYVSDFFSKFLGNAEQTAEVAVAKTRSIDLSLLATPLNAVWGTAKQIPIVAVGIIVSIVSCCFMTADYASFKKLVEKIAGEKNSIRIITAKRILFSTVGKVGKAYLIIICVTFTEMLIGLSALKIFGLYTGGYVFAIALITALVDILPVLGTGTILLPWGIYSLLSGNVGFGIGILVIYAVITIIRQAIEPKLVADQLGLPPYITIIAMYIGTQLFGFIGLFLLPVSIMLIKVLNDKGVIHLFSHGDVDSDAVAAQVKRNLSAENADETGQKPPETEENV